MKDIDLIDSKTKIRIKNNHLSAYLERIEASGYLVKANKCKGKEGFRDVLMIGRTNDFEKFFSECSGIGRREKGFASLQKYPARQGEDKVHYCKRKWPAAKED